MRKPSLRSARFAIAAVVLLLTSACGSTSTDGSPDVSTTTAVVDDTTPDTTSTTAEPTTTTTTEAPVEVDPLSTADGPLVFFGAMPPKPTTVDYRIPLGSTDYFELFEPDAPWADALENIDMFRLQHSRCGTT